MKIRRIDLLITVLLIIYTVSGYAGELLNNKLSSCDEVIDSIRQKSDNGESLELQTFEQLLTKPQKLKFFMFGFGPSFFNNADISRLSYDFYGGRYWQLKDEFSIGGTGEILTEFHKAILFSVAASALYYPFYSIIMPFGGFSLGPGFIHAHGESDFGAFSSVELGAIVPKTFPFILMISGRLNVFMQRFPLPLVYSLRIGTAW